MSNKSIFFSSGLFALSLGFAACSSEDFAGSQDAQDAQEVLSTANVVSFSAAFDDNLKKIAYGDFGLHTPINWVEGDQIHVYSDKSGLAGSDQWSLFTADEGGSERANFTYVTASGAGGINPLTGKGLTWTKSEPEQQSFYAIYPGGSSAGTPSIDALGFSFTIPRNQTPASANDGMDYVVLYAATGAIDYTIPVSLNFDNVPTVLKVTIPEANDRVIDRIEVTAKGENAYRIAGTFSAPIGTSPVTSFPSFDAIGTSNVIAATLPAGWKNGTTHIAVAPYALTDITVTLVDEDGNYVAIPRGKSVVGRTLYDMNIPAEMLTTDKWVSGGEGNMTFRTSKNSADFGIWVVSSVNPTTGAITTSWISNGVDKAWDIESGTGKATLTTITDPTLKPGATSLYFAAGNLHIPKSATDEQLEAGNWGVIALVDNENVEFGSTGSTLDDLTGYGSNALNGGFYGWGDPFGKMALSSAQYPYNESGYEYPDGVSPEHISGSKWDIARHQLGNSWRLPTVVEWSFLVEMSNAMPVSGSRYTSTTGYNSWYNNSTVTPWQDDAGRQGYTLSANGESIFLPALGNRSSSSVTSRGSSGFYWSGAFYSASYARNFYFNSSSWFVYYDTRNFGFAVRPVSE